jgi:hypothetical protein
MWSKYPVGDRLAGGNSKRSGDRTSEWIAMAIAPYVLADSQVHASNRLQVKAQKLCYPGFTLL